MGINQPLLTLTPTTPEIEAAALAALARYDAMDLAEMLGIVVVGAETPKPTTVTVVKCANGHERTSGNKCVECRREQCRRYREKHKERINEKRRVRQH